MKRGGTNEARPLVDASEQELRRLAKRLHGGLAQSLTALSVMAKVVANRLKDLPAVDKAELQQLRETIDSTMDEARLLIRALKPPDLEEDGLADALAELTTWASKIVPCHLQFEPRLAAQTGEIALSLFRIVQHAVENAMENARPSQINIRIEARENTLFLEVADDGLLGAEGNGKLPNLEMMQSHARCIGGALKVKRSGKGTTVTCTVPFLRPRPLSRPVARAKA